MELTSYSERAARLVNTADPGRPNHDALQTLDGLRGFLDGHPLWQEQANQRDLGNPINSTFCYTVFDAFARFACFAVVP